MRVVPSVDWCGVCSCRAVLTLLTFVGYVACSLKDMWLDLPLNSLKYSKNIKSSSQEGMC